MKVNTECILFFKEMVHAAWLGKKALIFRFVAPQSNREKPMTKPFTKFIDAYYHLPQDCFKE